MPFRRYKMWVRMGAAVRSMTAGRSLTEAALAAGFASSSHFSAAFREMFGLSPVTTHRGAADHPGQPGLRR